MDLKCRSMGVVLLSIGMHPVIVLKMLVKCFIICHGKTMSWGVHFWIGNILQEAIGNMLVDMYAKLGSIEDAFKVFDGLKNPSYHCQTHSIVQEKTKMMNKIWFMVVIY